MYILSFFPETRSQSQTKTFQKTQDLGEMKISWSHISLNWLHDFFRSCHVLIYAIRKFVDAEKGRKNSLQTGLQLAYKRKEIFSQRKLNSIKEKKNSNNHL